ncbi:L-glutamate gamma-semialdehyde dehydrogenase [Kroppenstedtia eburnea]|uniref:L-glutamate gamma-semialdehyde dehydrogenase n=1 Tax=Kroppenstedtia eburnea TaxID=714067 RepID=UPI00363DA121
MGVTPFRKEPLTDFSQGLNRAAFEAALSRVENQLGRDYPLIIGGEEVFTEKKISSINPSQLDQVIGYVARGDKDLAEKAIQAAVHTFESWKRVAPEARADILRRRKHQLSAWMVLEAGKSWVEADADTAEAIDFLEYYGWEMIRLAQPVPRIVIPPWNFPLAIMVGLTVSSIVAGNTVVLKPASNTSVIAAQFMKILNEGGLPEGVVNFLPGPGGEVGEYLVQHSLARYISFTGSREVGLRINELAAKTAPGQKWIKRVIAEMGGKNSIIVDREADLEQAAAEIVRSAFGFCGQKCSACSKAIIHKDVYDTMLEKVTRLTQQLKVAPARNLEIDMGPVVDERAVEKIMDYIEIGKKEGRLVTGGGRGKGNGYFIQPTLFADVDPEARICKEEIFGPVLAFVKAKDFDHALAIANNTEYGLTGSVYSRNRSHLEKARDQFHVGNLYFNRKCTGALVGVHPFGGFNMSGTDSKAGGPDYLLQFTQAKLVSEVF